MTALELARDAPAARPTIARMLAALIATLSPGSYDAELETQLLACLGEPTLDPQPLAQNAAALWQLRNPDVDATEANQDPPWQIFHTSSPITPDPQANRDAAYSRPTPPP